MPSILDDIQSGGFLQRAEQGADFVGIPAGDNPVLGDPLELPEEEGGILSSIGEFAWGGLNLADQTFDALGRASRTFIGTGDIEQSIDAFSDREQALYGSDLKEMFGIGDFGEEDNSGFSPLANPEEFLRDTMDFAVDVGIEIATDPLTYLGVGLLSRGAKAGVKATGAARQIISDITQGTLTRVQGNAKYMAEFGKDLGLQANPGGKFPGLADTFAKRIKDGDQSLLSLNVPFTEINVPLFPQASAAIAEKGGVLASYAEDFLGLTPFGRAVGRGISKFKNIFVADNIENAIGEVNRISGNKATNLVREYSLDIHKLDDIMRKAKLTPDERSLVRLHAENFDDLHTAGLDSNSFAAKEARKKTKAIQERINALPSEKQEAVYLASRKASEAGNRLFADAQGAGIHLDELGGKISKELEDAKDFVDELEAQHLERLQKQLKEREGKFLHDQAKEAEMAQKLFTMDQTIKAKRKEFRQTKDPALRQEITELSGEQGQLRRELKIDEPNLRERQANRLAAIKALRSKLHKSDKIDFTARDMASPSFGGKVKAKIGRVDGELYIKKGDEVSQFNPIDDPSKLNAYQNHLREIGANLGVDVRYIPKGLETGTRGSYFYDAASNRHNILLDEGMEGRDLAHIFGHEMMHFGLRSLDDDAKASLILEGHHILDKNRNNRFILEELRELYEKSGRKFTLDDALEELIVDAGGKLMADDGLRWIARAAEADPSVGARIAQFLTKAVHTFKTFIAKLGDPVAAKEMHHLVDDLQKVVFGLTSPNKQVREEALRALNKTTEAQQFGADRLGQHRGFNILNRFSFGENRGIDDIIKQADTTRVTRRRQAEAIKEGRPTASEQDQLKGILDDVMNNQDPIQLMSKVDVNEGIVISEARLLNAQNKFQEPTKLVEARKKLAELQAKKAKVPNWMPAILTEKAMDRFLELSIFRSQKIDRGTLRASFERTFRDKGGVPLDIEDINKMEKRGLKELGRLPIAGDITLGQAYQFLRSNDKKAANKAAKMLGKLVKVDPAEILEISSRNTAKAISEAEYANGLKRIWGFEIDKPGGNLTPGFVDAGNLHRNLKGIALPVDVAKAAAKHYEAAARITDIAGGMMAPIQDFTRMWKMFQTQLFPGFHLRNKIANLFRRAQEGGLGSGMENRAPLSQLYFRMLKNGEKDSAKFKDLVFNLGPHGKMKGNEFIDRAYKEGVIGTGFMAAEIGANSVNQIRGGFFNSVSSAFTKNTKIARLSELVEESDRLEHYIARLRKGDTHAQAAYSVEKALFNYRRVSKAVDFARHSGLLPFAAWSAKNLPAQFEILFRRPGQFAAMVHAKSAIENGVPGIPEDRLPKWLQDKYNIRTRKNEDGTWEIVTLTGIVPMADLPELTNLPQFFGQLLGPIPKEMAQQLFNTNLFTKKAIKEFDGQYDVINIPPFDVAELHPRTASMIRTLAGRPVSLGERMTRELRKLGSGESTPEDLHESMFGGGGITSAITGIPLDTRTVGKKTKYSMMDLKKNISTAKRQLAKVKKERPNDIDKQLALMRVLQKLEQRKRAAEIP